MAYVDGCVLAVPTAKKQEYLEHAKRADALIMEFGATRVVDCWGDDVPTGERTDFMRAVQATPEETVVFSWIEWPNKAARDAGMEKMKKDPRMSALSMPFDGKRMIFGGFEPLLQLGSA
ncbi:MAG: DUF1428 domain-containing protein [Luteimonas sp.]